MSTDAPRIAAPVSTPPVPPTVLAVSYETGYSSFVKVPGAVALKHPAGPGKISRLIWCGEIEHGTKSPLSGGPA